jgi:two-component system, LytTR family, sensor histidine kinase AlgZ
VVLFTVVVFLGVLMPIVGLVILIMIRLFDQELDVLGLENVKVRLEKELQESEYKQLTERIQPHFLFNTLNAFLSLSRIGRQQDMTYGLERFSLFLRYRYQDHDVLVPFLTELEHTKNYLAIQQLRFGPRLSIEYALSPSAVDCKIPPYTLQTLVENSFKHGLEKKPGDKSLKISLEREGNWVSLKVVDNGVETIDISHSLKGTGLANIRRRFQLIFDLPAFLTLSKNGHGKTVAHAYWPYIPEDDEDERPNR